MSKVDSYTPIHDSPAVVVDTKIEQKLETCYTPVDQIPVIVDRLRAYFKTHASKPYEWRRSQLQAIHKLLTENEKQLCDALKKDFNKPFFEASLGDVGLAIHDVTETLSNLKSYMSPESAPTPLALLPGSSFVHHDPYGVVLIIAPFNYPIQLIFQPLIAAVAAGNVAVIKPSELTPATTAVVAELIPKYLDRSAFAVIQGAIPETKALLDQRWDYIFFTGSEMVGKVVAAAAAKHLTPVTLELGGKSPVIICDDADITIAARRVAWGKYFNCGQSCVAPDYVFIDSKIKEAFLKQLTKTIEDFYGKDPASSSDYTRIVNDRHANRLAEIVAFHKNRSEILYGGNVNLAERYISPTVVEIKTKDETTKGSAMGDELFGPILPLIEFKTAEIDRVIEYINDKPKPLALYLFTSKSSIQKKVIEHTSSGGVAINDCMVQATTSGLPFGGVGSSGVGNYHGKYGFNTFSHAKSVMKKYNFGDAPMRYPPYTNFNYAAFRWATSIYRVNSGTIGKFFKFVALPIAVLAILRGVGVSLTYKSNL